MKKAGKAKKALIAVGCVVLAVAVGAAIWVTSVHFGAKKNNLIKLDTSSVPEPVAGPEKEDYVQLSDVKMHYAVYGKGGHPLILIHGNSLDLTSLDEAARYLANDYTVYSLDSRCHGKSTDPGEISYDLMAKDVKEFIEKTGLEKPYVVGHSDGAIVALTVAYTYPDLLGGFVACGANTDPKTFKAFFTLAVKNNNRKKPDKLNDMMLTEPHITKDDLSKIKCPAYIVAGEFDIMDLSDTVFIHDSIKDSKIAIVEMNDHSSYIARENSGEKAYALVSPFFKSLED
ncbi:MAG: alpha/beta hydrolase [Clostridia bacterium]|nr:alpha/beta hydrolase [Clostridia bacterium]